MFSEASVCSQGGVSVSEGGGEAAQPAVVSMHPTGMHSCLNSI